MAVQPKGKAQGDLRPVPTGASAIVERPPVSGHACPGTLVPTRSPGRTRRRPRRRGRRSRTRCRPTMEVLERGQKSFEVYCIVVPRPARRGERSDRGAEPLPRAALPPHRGGAWLPGRPDLPRDHRRAEQDALRTPPISRPRSAGRSSSTSAPCSGPADGAEPRGLPPPSDTTRTAPRPAPGPGRAAPRPGGGPAARGSRSRSSARAPSCPRPACSPGGGSRASPPAT